MRARLGLIVATLAIAFAAPALAEKPAHAGGGRGHGGGQGHGQGHGQGGGPPGQAQPGPGPAAGPGGAISISITTGDQLAIRQYYGQQAAAGHCPPGLAKKNNGCLPPGQAKKWAVGYPLAAGIAYYPLPAALLGRLSPAPAGYAYVQVGPDVLLMGISTRMIMASVALF